jgi:hypothetical protein
MRPLTAGILLVTLVATLAPRAADAQEVQSDFDAFTGRRWRFVLNVPSVSLNAYPLGWAMRGEAGVEFARFNVIMASVSIRPDSMIGGGVGYMYQHMFVRNIFYLQAGAFLGFWDIFEGDVWEGGEEVLAFFSPTVRVMAGYAFVFFQVGFTVFIGTSAAPIFDLGLHLKV